MTANKLEDWLSHIRTVHFRSIDMTLERVRSVLERMAPSIPFRVIAVAGTNGKGSCSAMLGSVLRECGDSVGVYTSPHLVRFNERTVVDGKAAGDRELCEAFQMIEEARGDTPLTYFEFATLAAVSVFQTRRVDTAVMEVGMGGRLDAVNALPLDAALITNVDLDHMNWLGSDRESIGSEKARVMRAGRPAVFGHPEPPLSVLAYAREIGAELLVDGRDYHYQSDGGHWRWIGPGGESWRLPRPRIPGNVQIQNAAAVVTLLNSWSAVGLDPGSAGRGLRNAGLRARCEILSRQPMVVIDVAHNLSALGMLKRCLAEHPVSGQTLAVFGMLRDKEPGAVVREMDDQVDAWHVAGIADERGQTADELAVNIDGLVSGPVQPHDDAVTAFRAALDQAGDIDRIVVFGSFHIAGDILRHTERQS